MLPLYEVASEELFAVVAYTLGNFVGIVFLQEVCKICVFYKPFCGAS
jgi:hypothetical protein